MIKSCCRRPLKRFSFGVVDELAKHTPEFLEILSLNEPEQVEQLSLASIREEPGNFKSIKYDVKLFRPFTKLQVSQKTKSNNNNNNKTNIIWQILSVDYDVVSDTFLHNLEMAMDLKRLVVHINGVDENHPGTTNTGWQKFKMDHVNCELRLTMVHAYQDVYNLNVILKRNMPLSHLKVFFCEYVSYRS